MAGEQPTGTVTEETVNEVQQTEVLETGEQTAVSWPVPLPTPSITPTPVPEGVEYADPSKSQEGEDGNRSITEQEETSQADASKEESGTLSGSGNAPEGAGSENGTGATGEMKGTDNETKNGGSTGGGTSVGATQKPAAENGENTAGDNSSEGTAVTKKGETVPETESTEFMTEITEESPQKKATSRVYVPYFDPELGEYVIFDEADLLSKSEEKPVSMNEQVRRSGHMIEKYSPFTAVSINNNPENGLGIGLLTITLVVVAALVVVLMMKQKPDGEKYEEN